MSEHTPGPWHYIGDEDGDFMVLAGEETFVANIGEPIQAVSLNPKAELVAFNVDQANVRLIAAAPALLERAKEVEAILKFAFEDGALPAETINGLCIDPYGVLADLRHAIALASPSTQTGGEMK